jgi:hypothetical protein
MAAVYDEEGTAKEREKRMYHQHCGQSTLATWNDGIQMEHNLEAEH